jgi:hypothetical protein
MAWIMIGIVFRNEWDDDDDDDDDDAFASLVRGTAPRALLDRKIRLIASEPAEVFEMPCTRTHSLTQAIHRDRGRPESQKTIFQLNNGRLSLALPI